MEGRTERAWVYVYLGEEGRNIGGDFVAEMERAIKQGNGS